jgi:hypothetical protein
VSYMGDRNDDPRVVRAVISIPPDADCAIVMGDCAIPSIPLGAQADPTETAADGSKRPASWRLALDP